MVEDIRVILIKLADRLHNMRTLDSMPDHKKLKIAGETLFIYAPLAHRLGLNTIKSELEDLSLKYEHPKIYEEISERLKEYRCKNDILITRFSLPIIDRLSNEGFEFDITGRPKSIYSIWSKMQKKNISFEEIYDLLALRVVFKPKPGIPEKTQCWNIYSVVTDLYKPKPDRLRDWVSVPKANGYEALHSTVMGLNGRWVEVQIRSERMNDIAERGFAAHWKYKEHNIEEDSELDKWLHTITEILENPNPNSLDFLDTIKMNLFTAEIFVFTPKGDLKTLPKDATALDFAYNLHTNIGDTCIGAKVNHNLVPLSHKLESGDQVEIITSKSQRPKAEWLNYVTTAKARTKIEVVLRRERKELAKAGKEIVKEALKKASLESVQSNMDKLSVYFGFSNREDFYYAVKKGDVEIPDNLRKILKEESSNSLIKGLNSILRFGKKKPVIDVSPSKKTMHENVEFDKTKPYELLEDALGARNYVVAGCCKPIPGDDVFGFINDDNTVIVHKHTCHIGLRLKSSFGNRILSTVWSNHTSTSFEATLKVVGIDAVGVLTNIANTISSYNVNIIRLLIEARDGMFEGKIYMLVHDVEDIQEMCISLSKINNIKSVTRVAD